MMNKQEAIEELEENKRDYKATALDIHWNNALNVAINIIKQLDEPKKAVVPQFVADWLVVCKENLAVGLSIAMRFSFLAANDQPEETIQWFKSPSNQETFAQAWIYGYEVEKEKLYIVFQPATHEFLYADSGSLRSDAVTWAYAAETEEYHFTQQKLEELHYWNNQAFEIKEVTE